MSIFKEILHRLSDSPELHALRSRAALLPFDRRGR